MIALRRDSPRVKAVLQGFEDTFGAQAEALFSAPGRTELIGNHTDHQCGCVIAAGIELDILAAVRVTGGGVVRVKSAGYPMDEVELSSLGVRSGERNRSAALIRGVAAGFSKLGRGISGFDAYTVSDVLKGGGMSSSAAFETLLGTAMSSLFCGGEVDAVSVARLGQYAENVYFGKPSGLMDQMASAVGGAVFMDFRDPEQPHIERLEYDFSKSGHALCIIDSGAEHSMLTCEYAAITEELAAVCALFGRRVLREIPQEDFMRRIPEIRGRCGDRAALRAMHVYGENRRAERARDALRRNDFALFLKMLRESGQSSFMYLQNVIPSGAVAHQQLALALALCDGYLQGSGSFRVHGGGFAGTVQAFVPEASAEDFRRYIDGVLGEGRCRILRLRPAGGSAVTLTD